MRTPDANVSRLSNRERAEFSDYRNAVTFVSSMELWLHQGYGGDSGTLRSFDRFASLDGDLTPDFVATFSTQYVLCGEYMKTFRADEKGTKDLLQLSAYSCSHFSDSEGQPCSHDVLLIVAMESDDIATAALRKARQEAQAEFAAPVVVIGYKHDTERVNGDWYVLKWRALEGNSQFSRPNAVSDPQQPDLNSLLTVPAHVPIQVDLSVVSDDSRNPFINDTPPGLYAAIIAIFPVLNKCLTDEQRDELDSLGEVTVDLTRDEIMLQSGADCPERHFKAGIEYLVYCGQATPLRGTSPPKYRFRISRRWYSQRLEDTLPREMARRLLRRTSRGAARGGSHGDSPHQQRLPL